MLSGKTAVITGAGRGIGREIALLLAAGGCRVTAADINYAGVKEVVHEITDMGGEAFASDVDIADYNMVDCMMKRTVKKFGRIDIIVNNAAYVKKSAFLDYSPEEWTRVVNVSLNGYFYCSQLGAKEMIKSGGGKIINIASMVGIVPHGGLAAYSASKSAVLTMTKLAANELIKHNIAVNAIAPGPTDTPLMKNVLERKEGEAEKIIPKAIISSAGAVAKSVLFLALDKDNIINGNTINIGGAVLG